MPRDTETYKSMVVGIALFLGGMIAVIVLMEYLRGKGFLANQPTGMTLKQIIPLTGNTLRKIDSSIQNQSPAGEFVTRTYTVTDSGLFLDEKTNFGNDLNWMSLDITNYGPNPVYVSVNNLELPEAPLPVGQSINIPMGQRGIIKSLYLKCDRGQMANVSLYIIK